MREKFLSFLLRRPCTRKQALEFLERQKVTEQVIDSLMLEAESLGLIDDSAYARLFAEGHTTWGNLKIAHELGLRGVSREDVEIALDEMDDESERARELIDSWRKGGIEERKITARLLSRGFTNRAVRNAMS